MRRRTFLTGLSGLIAAPALVRAASLDYVPRGMVLARLPWPWVMRADGVATIPPAIYELGRPLESPGDDLRIDVRDCTFRLLPEARSRTIPDNPGYIGHCVFVGVSRFGDHPNRIMFGCGPRIPLLARYRQPGVQDPVPLLPSIRLRDLTTPPA